MDSQTGLVLQAADKAMEAVIKARTFIFKHRTETFSASQNAAEAFAIADSTLRSAETAEEAAFLDIDPEVAFDDADLWEAHLSALNAASLARQAANEASLLARSMA